MGRLGAFLDTTTEKRRDLEQQKERRQKSLDDEEFLRLHLRGAKNDYSDVGGGESKAGGNFAKQGDPNKSYEAAESKVQSNMKGVASSIYDRGATSNPADDKPLSGDNMSPNDYKLFCDSYGIRLSDMLSLPVPKRKAVMSSANPRYALQRAMGSK